MFSIISEIGVPVVARRRSLEGAGQDLHLVRFLALRDELRLARAALVEQGLDVGLGQGDARRAAVDDAANAGPWLSPQVVTRKRWPKVLWDIL